MKLLVIALCVASVLSAYTKLGDGICSTDDGIIKLPTIHVTNVFEYTSFDACKTNVGKFTNPAPQAIQYTLGTCTYFFATTNNNPTPSKLGDIWIKTGAIGSWTSGMKITKFSAASGTECYVSGSGPKPPQPTPTGKTAYTKLGDGFCETDTSGISPPRITGTALAFKTIDICKSKAAQFTNPAPQAIQYTGGSIGTCTFFFDTANNNSNPTTLGEIWTQLGKVGSWVSGQKITKTKTALGTVCYTSSSGTGPGTNPAKPASADWTKVGNGTCKTSDASVPPTLSGTAYDKLTDCQAAAKKISNPAPQALQYGGTLCVLYFNAEKTKVKAVLPAPLTTGIHIWTYQPPVGTWVVGTKIIAVTELIGQECYISNNKELSSSSSALGFLMLAALTIAGLF